MIAVVGATATGKSDLALDLAQRLAGEVAGTEIVNADAMQLYRGMDIGTAKVPLEGRRGIAHRQLDVLDVDQDASVAAYQRHARADVAQIAARGATAVVVGGSGLYVRALLDDLSFPGTDPHVRAELEARASREGSGVLHDELAAADPTAAERIDRRNARRIVRALEVIRLTGEPFSANLPDHRYAIPAIQVGLRWERESLHERIERRTAMMFDQGLVEETRELMDRGLESGRTASRAVGYAQAIAVVRGELSPQDAQEATMVATRQLARRQETWFGRDPRVRWIECSEGDDDAKRQTVHRALRAIGHPET